MIRNVNWSHLDEKKNDWIQEPCIHPEHEFPNMMVIPPEGYTHTCPACGKKTFAKPQRIYL